MKYLFLLIFFSNNLASSQIIVDGKTDNSAKIDSALTLIKECDPKVYTHIESVCSRISIWEEAYSFSKDSHIFISANDFKLNSINNIACAIVHESMHTYFEKCRESGLCKTPESNVLEEKYCYSYEYNFFMKLPNREYWLETHILKSISMYSE